MAELRLRQETVLIRHDQHLLDVRGHAPQLGAIPVLAQWLVMVLADEAVRSNQSPEDEPCLQGKYREICRNQVPDPAPHGHHTAENARKSGSLMIPSLPPGTGNSPLANKEIGSRYRALRGTEITDPAPAFKCSRQAQG